MKASEAAAQSQQARAVIDARRAANEAAEQARQAKEEEQAPALAGLLRASVDNAIASQAAQGQRSVIWFYRDPEQDPHVVLVGSQGPKGPAVNAPTLRCLIAQLEEDGYRVLNCDRCVQRFLQLNW